jgi:hypothetical protein
MGKIFGKGDSRNGDGSHGRDCAKNEGRVHEAVNTAECKALD